MALIAILSPLFSNMCHFFNSKKWYLLLFCRPFQIVCFHRKWHLVIFCRPFLVISAIFWISISAIFCVNSHIFKNNFQKMALIDIMPRLNIRGLSPYTIPYSILIVGILAKIKGKIIGIISISAIFLKFFQLIWEFTQKMALIDIQKMALIDILSPLFSNKCHFWYFLKIWLVPFFGKFVSFCLKWVFYM